MIGIILSWLGFFVFFITSIILYYAFQKRRKVFITKEYEKELEKYSFENLNNKFSLLSSRITSDKNEINDLEDEIKNLEVIILNEVKIKYNNIYNHISGWYKFKFLKFSKLSSELFEKQFEYKTSYLKILFRLNEFSLKNEIKKSLIFNVKNVYNFLNNRIDRSKYSNEIKMSNIVNKLHGLDDLIEESSKLSDDLTFSLEKYVGKIQTIILKMNEVEKDIKFLEETFETINLTFKNINNNFKSITSDNRDAFEKRKNEWKSSFTELNKKINNIKKNTFLLEKSLAKKELYNAIEAMTSITKNALLNKEAYLFITEFDKKLEFLLKNFKKDEQKILVELERFSINDKKNKINEFKNINNSIKAFVNSYITKRKNKFTTFEPIELINDLSKIQLSLSKYFSLLENAYLEIEQIMNKTDDINKKVYSMNVTLLKVEDKIENISPESRFIYEQELENFQSQVSRLIEDYRKNMQIPSQNKIDDVNNLFNNIENFYQKVYTEAFKFTYIQKLIIILNKYISNRKISALIEDMKMKYREGNIVDSLRVAKKIIEIGGIYE